MIYQMTLKLNKLIDEKEICLLMIKKILKIVNEVKISYLFKLKLPYLINIKSCYFN